MKEPAQSCLTKQDLVFLGFNMGDLTANQLAQLIEHWTAVQEVAGSSNNWGERTAFVMTPANG